jgi:hypothetical protein
MISLWPYFFRINDGKYSGIAGPDNIGDGHTAWTEMTAVCSD